MLLSTSVNENKKVLVFKMSLIKQKPCTFINILSVHQFGTSESVYSIMTLFILICFIICTSIFSLWITWTKNCPCILWQTLFFPKGTFGIYYNHSTELTKMLLWGKFWFTNSYLQLSYINVFFSHKESANLPARTVKADWGMHKHMLP